MRMTALPKSDDDDIGFDATDPDGEHDDADESQSDYLNKLYGGEDNGSPSD